MTLDAGALRPIRTVGFVGLGAMGSGIARRLMDAGHTVVGWNRTKDKAADLLAATTSHGNIPEPLRLAHIIAGGVERGASRGRP